MTAPAPTAAGPGRPLGALPAEPAAGPAPLRPAAAGAGRGTARSVVTVAFGLR